MSDLIDCNNSPHQWLSPPRREIQGCIATTDCSLLLLRHSVFEINKHPLSCAPTPFSIPSLLSCHHLFFGGQEQSPSLMGAPRRIEFNSWRAERGWLASPAQHYLPFTSFFLPCFPNGIPARRSSSRRSQMEQCFVPPMLPSFALLPAQAACWKITFWGQTIIILPAPMHPAPVSSY